MQVSRAQLQLGIVLFGIGACLGALVEHRLAERGRAPEHVSPSALAPSSVEGPKLDAAVAALAKAARELEETAARIGAGERPSLAQREVAAPDASALAKLVEELERELAELRRTEGSTGTASLHHPSLPHQGEPVAFEEMRDAMRNALDSKRFYAAQTDFRERHLLWSYQDVLDAYGRPQEIAPGHWTYQLPSPAGGTDVLGFSFSDGLVVDASYGYLESHR